jgi:response regulator RpfG family c-di-GMP phosphodiesterase
VAEQAKILVVDDREENLIALERTLEGMDLQVFRALSGNEGLALTLEHEFALALVDVQMPEMDGFEMVTLLRGNSRTKHLPVIFVSAIYSDEFYQVKGIESGAVDFMVKPLNVKILRGKISVFLDLYRQRKALESALEEIKTLHGLLPICSFCKKIRDDNGYWNQLEEYFSRHSDLDFSHSICPDCLKKHYKDFVCDDLNREESAGEDSAG